MIIKKITKMSNYYKVEFLDYETLKFHEKTLIKYHLLKKGLEIEKRDFEKIMFDNEVNFAVSTGLDYLSSVHSKKEVRDKLLKKYSKEATSVAIKELVSLNVINDNEYASYFLDYCINNCYGPVYFSYELNNQMINGEVVEELKSRYTTHLELEAIEKLLEKYLRGIKNQSLEAAKNKVKKYLLSRGFTDRAVSEATISLSESLGSLIDEEAALERDKEKALNAYKKKYSGKELTEHVVNSLLRKGYKYSSIKKILNI